MAVSRLQAELSFFDEHRDEYCRSHRGKFALIKGRELHGFFDTDVAAFEAGVEIFLLGPFLIKKVETVEEERMIVPEWPATNYKAIVG